MEHGLLKQVFFTLLATTSQIPYPYHHLPSQRNEVATGDTYIRISETWKGPSLQPTLCECLWSLLWKSMGVVFPMLIQESITE